MLPPFRIRHLRASDNPAGPDLGDDFLSSPIHQDEDAVVVISEPVYDSLLSRHPEAALSYLDEDDGEIITVSVELDHALVNADAVSADRNNGAVDIWRRVISVSLRQDREMPQTSRRSKGKQRATQSPAWEDCIPERPTNDLKVEVDESDNICRETELNQERELDHLLQARTNGKWTRQSHDPSIAELEGRILEPEQDELARETSPAPRGYLLPLRTTKDDATNLTSEGKRQQAQEAGAKLRSSLRSSWSSHPISSEGEKEVHRDRWASYGRAPSSLSSPTAPQNVSQHMEFKESLPTDRPLLDVFEDELRNVLSRAGPSSVADEKLPAEQASSRPSPPAAEADPNAASVGSPGELFANTLRSLVDGVGLLASDLQSRLSEVHDPTASVPQTVHRALQTAFAGFGSHIQGLANITQDASRLARIAADRSREADVQALEGAVEGLRSLAIGVGEFSKGIFSSPPMGSTEVSSVRELPNNGNSSEATLEMEESTKSTPAGDEGPSYTEVLQDKVPQQTPEQPTGFSKASVTPRSSTSTTADRPPAVTEEAYRTYRQATAPALEEARGPVRMATNDAQTAATQLHREACIAVAAQAAEDAKRIALSEAARAKHAAQRAAGAARRDAIESAIIARRFALQNARSVREVISQNNGVRVDASGGVTNPVNQGEPSKGGGREKAARLTREEMSGRRRQLRKLAIKDSRPWLDQPSDERDNVGDGGLTLKQAPMTGARRLATVKDALLEMLYHIRVMGFAIMGNLTDLDTTLGTSTSPRLPTPKSEKDIWHPPHQAPILQVHRQQKAAGD
ncbi:hypothetical protein GP486_001076 [Trichoglossum hirsutum]|uniref:Uncharacterized protein n=1 Tax=Trichoglossum hirsutum TaxID=265104 RepID=A0A9P8LHC4_9PEZI|nr:hypothetical protein GP486_001076 [Trichoglossum hirsutum]